MEHNVNYATKTSLLLLKIRPFLARISALGNKKQVFVFCAPFLQKTLDSSASFRL